MQSIRRAMNQVAIEHHKYTAITISDFLQISTLVFVISGGALYLRL